MRHDTVRLGRMLAPLMASAYLLVAAPLPAAGQTAYVTGGGGPGLVSADTVSGRADAQINPPAGDGGLAITPDGRTVYVTGVNAVTPVDTASESPGPAIGVGAGTAGIAVSPDGRTVYVASTAANSVTPIATATNLAGTPITVSQPTDIAIAPDGRTAYVVSAGDTLTPIDLTTGTTGAPIALGHQGGTIAITPDGTLAVVTETDPPVTSTSQAGYLQLVDLASAQAESPIGLNTLTGIGLSPAEPDDIAIAPDGRTAYLAGSGILTAAIAELPTGFVVPFDIPSRTLGSPFALPSGASQVVVTGDGATVYTTSSLCTALPCEHGPRVISLDFATHLIVGGLNTGQYNVGSIALVPDPSASFVAAPAIPGSPTGFDATASSDAGGWVTSYGWEFGDGTPPVTTTAPTVTHTYAQPGSYAVTLTTTNAGGCAATFIYTGHTASCTGSPGATTTRAVTVAPPAPPAAASATTGAVTSRTRTGAKLHGTIHAAGQALSWHFQYGNSTRYGHDTPSESLTAQRGSVPVSSILTRLAPNTPHHYRLVITTPGAAGVQPAVAYGSDMRFTTGATGSLRLESTALTLAGRSSEVSLSCVGGDPCRGRLSLTTLTGSPRHSVTCASTDIRLTANRVTRFRVTVGPTCRSLVRHARQHRISATVTSQLSTGQRGIAGTAPLSS